MDGAVPERVGGYRIVSQLGRGGSGVVYAGVHLDDGRPAAIKIADAAGALRTGWFRREASLAARLSHPGIVSLFTSGIVDGRPYLVFERIDGPTLEEIADEMDLDGIVSVALQLLDALGYAHDAGVVHCDVKPDNVLVAGRDSDTGHPVVKLADFGLAASREPEPGMPASLALVAGTPGYLSPEQARGAGHLPPSVDIYATGALLYRIVAGFPPHFGSTSTEVLERTLLRAPLPLRPRGGLSIPEELVDAIHGMLARDGAHRPASASRAKAMLVAALGREPTAVSATSATPAFGSSRSGIRAVEPEGPPTDVDPRIPAVDERSETVAVPSEVLMPTPLAIPVSQYVRRSAPLVGRDEQLRLLLGRLNPGPDGREDGGLPTVVRICGERGSGRTRLLREVAVRLESVGVRSFSVTGRRGTESPPFEILGALALEVAGAGGLTSPWLAAEQLSRVLENAGVADDDPGRDALVAGLCGVGLPTAVGQLQMHAYRAFDKLLANHASDRVVLVVDDADGADEESLAVLDALTRSPEGRALAPHVVVVTEEGGQDSREPHVEIGPLPEPRAVEMLSALTERPPSEMRSLAREVGGLPTDLAFAAVTWLAIGGRTERFDELVDARLGTTDPAVASVLRAAAVWQGDVPARSLVSVTLAAGRGHVESSQVDLLVQTAVLDGWIARVPRQAARLEASVRLCSARVRRHIRAQTTTAVRKNASRTAATWLNRDSLDGGEGMRAQTARLAEQAGELGVAAYAWAMAGRSDASRNARRYLARALELARADPDAAGAIDEPAVLARLAELALRAGEPQETERLAREGLGIVEHDRPVLVARLHRMASKACFEHKRHGPALECLDRALETLGDEGDPVELASALAEKGWLLAYVLGRTEEGIALGLRARAVAARVDAPRFRASLCGRLGANYLRAGDWDGQLAANLEDLGLSSRAADVGGTVRAHINLGVCYINRSLPAMARAHTEEALRIAIRYGRLPAAQTAHNNLAMIAADDGRPDDALHHAGRVLAMSERTGREAHGETVATRARVLMARGDLATAEEMLSRVGQEGGSAFERELAIRLLGVLDLLRGEPARAEARLGPVLQAGEYDPYERANTRLVHSRVLRQLGRLDEAAAEAARADEVYRRLGADPEAERARWTPEGLASLR